RGQEVDVAIYEAVAALMESSMADAEVAGVVRHRTGSILPGVAPSNAYPTADGSEVLIAANADSVWKRLAGAMGEPELADDERYATHHARGTNQAELDERIAAWTAGMDAATLLELLSEHKVPAGRVYTAQDALTDPHYLARDMVLRATARAGWDVPMTGVVPKFSRTPGEVRDVGPLLGEHTRQALRTLAAVGDEEWERLLAAGLVAAPE
ncbi:MAG: CoA transferase, partial [Actinomycetota bacterium]|nr:CoA transferase [Actinomycetota bacterium]